MGKYDGPSFYKQNHPKVEPITREKKEQKVAKYRLPEMVRTRKDLQKEATDYMETPSSLNQRFRSTKIPNSLQHLEGWTEGRRNHQLIAEISERLMNDSSEYLLFEEFMPEDAKPEQKSEYPSKPKSERKRAAWEKVKNPSQYKAERLQEKLAKDIHKPNSGLHRSLSNIIADDKKAMQNWNNNLDSLFTDEK